MFRPLDRAVEGLPACSDPLLPPGPKMPVGPLTAEEEAAASSSAQSDLKFLLQREEVPAALQNLFYHIGVTTLGRFAALVATPAELKTLLRVEFAVDADNSLAERVNVSKVTVAWRAACQRTEKVAELEGDAQARQLPRPLATSEYQSMRAAHGARWWELEDSNTPSKSLIEKLSDMIEANEPYALPLTEVTSKEEDERTDGLQAVWDASGAIKVRRTCTTVPGPTSPEGLRKRITLLLTGWVFVGLKHTNRQHLQGLTPQLGHDYLGYLLGDFVFNLVAKDGWGRVVATPGFQQVLEYDMAIRRKACKEVLKGVSLADAWRAAWNDATTKERHFTTPMALASVSTPASSQPSSSSGPPSKKQRLEPSPKKGKGRNKGRSKAGSPHGCQSKTPDGKAICFSYNTPGQACRPKCTFLHVCGRCFGQRPMYRCSGNASAPAAGGETRST